MKEIKCTKGFVILVDEQDYPKLAKHRWYAHCSGKGVGSMAFRPARRLPSSEGRKVVFLSRCVVSCPEGLVLDHINGKTFDNRRENLRVCTPAENSKNRAKSAMKKHPYKGIQKHKQRWRASIMNDGVTHRLGSFATLEDAALAYDLAAERLHGEYARKNFRDRLTMP